MRALKPLILDNLGESRWILHHGLLALESLMPPPQGNTICCIKSERQATRQIREMPEISCVVVAKDWNRRPDDGLKATVAWGALRSEPTTSRLARSWGFIAKFLRPRLAQVVPISSAAMLIFWKSESQRAPKRKPSSFPPKRRRRFRSRLPPSRFRFFLPSFCGVGLTPPV